MIIKRYLETFTSLTKKAYIALTSFAIKKSNSLEKLIFVDIVSNSNWKSYKNKKKSQKQTYYQILDL